MRASSAAIVTFALAACGGGGAGGSVPQDWTTLSVANQFNPAAAAVILADPMFQGSTHAYPGAPPTPPAHIAGQASKPYELIRLQAAHAAGFTGQGQLIAIVDGGFRATHNAFSGKTIHTYGPQQNDFHGTHVAALAAGAKNANSVMHGVAPDADLHLSRYGAGIPNLTAATLDAASKGAVA